MPRALAMANQSGCLLQKRSSAVDVHRRDAGVMAAVVRVLRTIGDGLYGAGMHEDGGHENRQGTKIVVCDRPEQRRLEIEIAFDHEERPKKGICNLATHGWPKLRTPLKWRSCFNAPSATENCASMVIFK